MNTGTEFPSTNSPEQEDILFGEQDYFNYEYASAGQRFANYLIDILLTRWGLSWLTAYSASWFLVNLFPDFYIDMIQSKEFSWYIFLFFIFCCNNLIYYIFCEKVFNGYTLGKFITGTRAIREDGGELTWKNAFLRTLSRLVPFEPFSIWGDGLWHDKWTKTMVIKSR